MAKRASFRPLDPASSAGASFIAEHFPDQTPIHIRRTGNLKRGNCYANVWQTISTNGGSALTGYMLICWPRHFIEALHHAVWIAPSGRIEDVTGPAYQGLERNHSCWFMPDQLLMGNEDMAIPSRFRVITEDAATIEWTKLAVQRVNLRRQMLDLPHEVETSFDGGRLCAFHDPRVTPLEKEHGEITARMEALWQRML